MKYLLAFTLPLFSFLWAEAIAAEYTVTPHDLRIDCYDNPSTGVVLSDQDSSDALDLTPITSRVKCLAGWPSFQEIEGVEGRDPRTLHIAIK